MKISQYDNDLTPALTDTVVTVKGAGNKEVALSEILELFEQYINPPDYIDLADTPDTITYVGNRSYALTFNGADHTDLLSKGMRMRLTRSVASPTRCTDLESGSSQYWNDTTVSGILFTDDFVAGAWIKLESYTGSIMNIISRFNGTSGWTLRLETDGRISVIGFNGSASNYSQVVSYQCVPIGKWIHVAGQLDMSAFTATSTTSYIMVDGVDVACSVARGGTNPTALVQAGNLEIGSANATQFFDGEICQVFVASAKITQDNLKTLISQGLTASLISTHSIASAYSFDGTSNDLNTTSANNLTAQNSALYTTLDTPFGDYLGGTYDYAIIATTPTYASNTTFVVQVPEGCMIPTSGGIATVEYSSVAIPYGFPFGVGKWRVNSIYRNRSAQASAVSGTTYNLGERLGIPAGEWGAGYKGTVYSNGTSAIQSISVDLNTTSATFSSGSRLASTPMYTDPATSGGGQARAEDKITTQSLTTYYLNIKAGHTGTNTQIAWLHDFAVSEIYADFGLL